MANKINEFIGRFSKNSKGMGAGVGALLTASGLFYGVTQSVFTGKAFAFIFDFILFIEVKQRLVSFPIKDEKLRFEL